MLVFVKQASLIKETTQSFQVLRGFGFFLHRFVSFTKNAPWSLRLPVVIIDIEKYFKIIITSNDVARFIARYPVYPFS